jgi:hypothetical protein
MEGFRIEVAAMMGSGDDGETQVAARARFLGILLPKILRITFSFFLCIHITHICCILLIDCLRFLCDR